MTEGKNRLSATCRDYGDDQRPTAWPGMSDSNSETSAQIMPLKSRADFLACGEFRPQRLFASELRGREDAARA
jgi:hypothetical protein